ncbi:MAG: sporulation protein YqfD [Bacilli bacterium]|nr:sporulation protein YqfD [Bacilli bacterium]
MNNLLIRIDNISIEEIIRITFDLNIKVYNIKYIDNYVLFEINNNDLEKLNNLYDIKIIKDNSLKSIINNIKNKLEYIILFILGIVLFYLLSNIIVNVSILSNNMDLVKSLNKSLDNYGIKRLSFKKNFIELSEIKKKLLNDYKENIEWLEIENIGMTYTIKLEERKKKNIDIDSNRCNVIASSDGIITKVIATKGIVNVKNNQSVKEGDILILGHITLNDEEKDDVCAKGNVYAEKWYSVSIDMPIKYSKKKYTNKKRYNILFELDNRDYKLFKSRLKNYDSDKEEIISILNKKLYLIKEYEYVDEILEYDEESLNKRIDDLIREKLELSLSDNERILVKNILKKEANDSRIKIELFVTVEKLISKQVTY